jgi:hypothetical protein
VVIVLAGSVGCWGGSAPQTRDATGRAPTTSVTPVFTPTPVAAVEEPAEGWFESGCALPLETLQRVRRGYYPGRSPEVMVVPREPNFFGGFSGTSHSGPWDYLQEVPLVFYGPGFVRGRGDLQLGREVTLADLAPTLAGLLDFSYSDTVGAPIDGVFVPDQRRAPPRLVLTVVLDGGGWNVLRAWPDAWPNYARLMQGGASVTDVIVGSSPSVTPAVHTTIGTGVFPKQHGITGIGVQTEEGVVGAYSHKSPEKLLTPTLADLYDPATGNAAKVAMLAYKSWHLGMIGHGAWLPGGDNDIAMIVNQKERLATNENFYSVPAQMKRVPGFEDDVRRVDLEDGRLDSTWMGHEMLDDAQGRRDSPAWILYQTRLLKALIETEGFGHDEVPDLLFTNYKQIDEIGHSYNMLSPEMRATIRHTDEAVFGTLPQFLNRTVGEQQWVMVVTADHGQTPAPLESRGWPISMGWLSTDVAQHFGADKDDLFDATGPVGFHFNEDTMQEEDITEEEIADFLIDYRLEDNYHGDDLPEQYEERVREPVFSAAFPSRELPRIWACAKHG